MNPLPEIRLSLALAIEPYGEPMERLLRASGSAEERIAVREIGDEFHLGASR